MKLWTALAAAALAIMPGQAGAQLMGAKRLTTGAMVKGLPATKSAADLYFLVGEVGAKETYTLTIKGLASLSLFTPDGHELVTASGSGKVALDAVLNFTDVFVLSVSRVDPGQAYTLSRRTAAPTFAEVVTSSFAGYSRSNETTSAVRCWLKPGIKLRETTPTYVRTITIAADRNTLIGLDTKPGGSESFEQTFRLEKFQYHMSVKSPDKEVREFSRPYPEAQYAFHENERPQFKGYLCD